MGSFTARATLASFARVARAALIHANSERAVLQTFQDGAVRRLVAHAAAQVPFYRQLFAHAGVDPLGIDGAAGLACLPVVTKDQLRSAPQREIIDRRLEPDDLLSISTTGSTGRPFRIFNSWREHRVLHAFRLRAHRQFGRRVGDRFAEIDQLIAPHPNDSKLIGKALRALRLEARVQLSLFDSTEVLLDHLEAFGPDIVTAYPNVLLRLGRALRERRRPAIRPRFLITNSEVLGPTARAALARLWECRVFQFYDCHECNLIAWDCPQGHGLHCNEDVAVVELLRNGRAAEVGQSGEVVITSLHSYAMPLIRFALGDVAVRGPTPCPCGQPFATLQAVEGRMVDFFRLPSGRWLHPYRLIENLDSDGVDWIQQYRLVQERENRIVFKVVPTTEATSERLAAFLAHARGAIGPDVEVEALFVDSLDLSPGGKFRPAQSLIPGYHRAPDWDTVVADG